MSKFRDLRRCCALCTHYIDDACALGVPSAVIQDPTTFVCARNEIRPPELVEHPRMSGFYTRDWFDDPAMTGEAVRFARRMGATPDDVVLDVGAHIGAFGCTMLREFDVKRCVMVEADPINLPALHVNAAHFGDRAHVLPVAAVGEVPPGGTLTLWRTGYTGCSSVLWRKRTFNVVVPTQSFTDILMEHRPTLLKVDVEGAELYYPWDVNDELRRVYVEVHRPDTSPGITRATADADLTRIIEKLKSQGFHVTHIKHRMAFEELEMTRV